MKSNQLAVPTLVASLAVLLAACSGSGGSPGAALTSSPSVSETPVLATPSATPVLRTTPKATALATPSATASATPDTGAQGAAPGSLAYSGTISLTDKLGYTFDIDYATAVRSITPGTAGDKPGFESALFSGDTQVTIRNTTPGRDLPFPEQAGTTEPASQARVALHLAWPAGSPVCGLLQQGSAGSGCTALLAYGYIPPVIPTGSATSVRMYRGSTGATPWNAGLGGIPEASAPAVLAAASHPQGLLISIGSTAGTNGPWSVSKGSSFTALPPLCSETLLGASELEYRASEEPRNSSAFLSGAVPDPCRFLPLPGANG